MKQKKMKNIRLFLTILLLTAGSMSMKSNAQTDSVGIDVFLSKNIIKRSPLSSVKLLDKVDVSSSQTIVLASKKSFYCIGYGEMASRPVTGKNISSFCILGNDVYFSDRSSLYKIGTDNKEIMLKRLPFTPLYLWAGNNVLYAVAKTGKTHRLYAIFPEKKKHVEFYTTTKTVISVAEYGPLIFVLTPESLVSIDIKGKTFSESPINTKIIGRALSMAVDKGTGDLYISSNKGVFRTHQGELQKVCADKGILCYDIDGILLFDNKAPFLFRLRNRLLYSKPLQKGVVIDIK